MIQTLHFLSHRETYHHYFFSPLSLSLSLSMYQHKPFSSSSSSSSKTHTNHSSTFILIIFRSSPTKVKASSSFISSFSTKPTRFAPRRICTTTIDHCVGIRSSPRQGRCQKLFIFCKVNGYFQLLYSSFLILNHSLLFILIFVWLFVYSFTDRITRASNFIQTPTQRSLFGTIYT